MRTTLARQLRRLETTNGTENLTLAKLSTNIKWREAHPRVAKQQPAKKHRRSRNRISNKNRK